MLEVGTDKVAASASLRAGPTTSLRADLPLRRERTKLSSVNIRLAVKAIAEITRSLHGTRRTVVGMEILEEEDSITAEEDTSLPWIPEDDKRISAILRRVSIFKANESILIILEPVLVLKMMNYF